jgi:hypothetical protein
MCFPQPRIDIFRLRSLLSLIQLQYLPAILLAYVISVDLIDLKAEHAVDSLHPREMHRSKSRP